MSDPNQQYSETPLMKELKNKGKRTHAIILARVVYI